MVEEKEIKLIEKKIKELDYPSIEELWGVVRGRIPQSKFDKILGYLLRTHHILINNGAIVWTWNPQIADRIFSNKELLIK